MNRHSNLWPGILVSLLPLGCIPPLIGDSRDESEEIAFAICSSYEECGFGLVFNRMPEYAAYDGVADCVDHEADFWLSEFRFWRAGGCRPGPNAVAFCVEVFENACDPPPADEFEMLDAYISCWELIDEACG